MNEKVSCGYENKIKSIERIPQKAYLHSLELGRETCMLQTSFCTCAAEGEEGSYRETKSFKCHRLFVLGWLPLNMPATF